VAKRELGFRISVAAARSLASTNAFVGENKGEAHVFPVVKDIKLLIAGDVSRETSPAHYKFVDGLMIN
jgi:hypothetical protein